MRGFVAAWMGTSALVLPAAAWAQTSPSNFTTAMRYDLEHRIIGTIAPDPDGSGPLHYLAVRNKYDAAGRLIKVEKGELAAWQSETVLPDNWASLTTFTIQQTVDTVYDSLDRKVQESVSSGGTIYKVTQYNYDAVGRLQCTAERMNPAQFTGSPTALFATLPDACTLGTTGTQGPDRITKNIYDDAGQLTQVRKAMNTGLEQAYVSYTYTGNSKQEYVTDANGNKARFIYDGHDRLSQWNFPDKVTVGTTSPTDYEAYQYDANGNRTYLRKRDGTVFTYSFDALDRMAAKVAPSGTRSVYYSYDSWGRQTAAWFDSVGGADAVGSAYDGFGRLVTSTTRMGGVSRSLTYLYDADGNRIRVTHPDGNYFTYDYDGLERMTAIHENGGGTVVATSWDAQARVADQYRGAVGISYGYDAISRPIGSFHDLAGTTSDLTTNFGYNPANQITSRTRSNTAYAFADYSAVNRAYSTNGLNQYAAVSGASYGYDANGNLTSDGSYTYAYDAENRLVSSSAGASLIYDPLGRLYQTSGGGAGITQFLYDGDQLTAEYNGSGTLLRRYVHGTGEDDPLLWYEGSGLTDRRSMQVDHQGSIVSIADSAGNATAVYNYDEYGIPGGAYSGRFQYTGQAYIPELGMYYYKARIYSPRLGRFMQTDPIGYKDQQNLYAYVNNDPTNKIDPSGLSDLNLLPTSFAQYEAAENFDIPGWYTISSHGGIGGLVSSTDGRWEAVSPSTLLDMARGNGYKMGDPTLLISCLLAVNWSPKVSQYTTAYAQLYSNASGGRVVAATGFVYFDKNKPNTLRVSGGEFRMFRPYGNGSTSLGNTAVFNPKTGMLRFSKDFETGSIIKKKVDVCVGDNCKK